MAHSSQRRMYVVPVGQRRPAGVDGAQVAPDAADPGEVERAPGKVFAERARAAGRVQVAAAVGPARAYPVEQAPRETLGDAELERAVEARDGAWLDGVEVVLPDAHE